MITFSFKGSVIVRDNVKEHSFDFDVVFNQDIKTGEIQVTGSVDGFDASYEIPLSEQRDNPFYQTAMSELKGLLNERLPWIVGNMPQKAREMKEATCLGAAPTDEVVTELLELWELTPGDEAVEFDMRDLNVSASNTGVGLHQRILSVRSELLKHGLILQKINHVKFLLISEKAIREAIIKGQEALTRFLKTLKKGK